MAIPLFIGQDSGGTHVAINHVKYASQYADLPSAFDDLCEGDILVVNRPGEQTESSCGNDWYEIERTCRIKVRNVHIIGRGGRIRAKSGFNVDPLLQITNGSSGREKLLEGPIVEGLRFDHDNDHPKGGTAVAVESNNATSDGSWGSATAVHLIDLFIANFKYGIRISNTWNIQIDNPLIYRCDAGIRIEKDQTGIPWGVGQIRIFGGSINGCVYSINLDEVNGNYGEFGQLQCYGLVFGDAPPDTPWSSGIYVGLRPEMIAIFGCHFEGINHGIVFAPNIGNHATNDIDPVVTIVGSTFVHMRSPGALVDTAQSDAAAVVSIGNYLGRRIGGTPTYNTPSVYQGMLIAGNNRPAMGPMAIPRQGLYEDLPAPTSTDQNAFRVSVFANAPIGPYIDGTIIFDASVSKLKVWQGGGWVTI